ncbi:MAG: hypothetical protein HYW49_10570 [Deltaproteobacteria bacterium]|nr:hypothetical protein [Deltaproteobacteria bacterium]
MTPRRSCVFLPTLATAAFLLAGCGDKFSREDSAPDGFTQVVFQRGAALPSLNLMAASLGNLIVFALNRDDPIRMGRLYLPNPGAGSTTTWTIPNGRYSFYVVGYDSLPIGGLSTRFCGRATGDDSNVGTDVFLLGGSKQVTINTATSDCVDTPFAPSGVASISLAFCTAGTNITYATAPTNDCTSSPVFGTASSNIGGVVVEIHAQDELGGPNYSFGPGLYSACIPLTSGVATLPFVPPGNPASIGTARIKVEIAAFSGCGPSPTPVLQAKYIFNTGLATANASTTPPWNVVKVDPNTGTPAEASDRAKWVSLSSQGRIFLKE